MSESSQIPAPSPWSLAVEYLRACRRRWVALITGSLPVAIYAILVAAFPGNQFPWNRLPQWVVWLLVVFALSAAQFLAWRDVRNDRDTQFGHVLPYTPSSEASARERREIFTFRCREDAYRAIPRVIQRVNHDQTGPKELLLAALHGHSGNRLSTRNTQISEFKAFDGALLECIRSVGPNMWKVHELYNITSEQRLDELAELLELTRDDDGYEVRAFCVPDAIPHLAPLVIGREDAFLGLEDPRFYRVERSVHIHNTAAVHLISAYFRSLWNDRRLIALRSAVEVDHGALDRLRSQIRARVSRQTN